MVAWIVCTIANACGWLKEPLRYEGLLAALLGERPAPRTMGANRRKRRA